MGRGRSTVGTIIVYLLQLQKTFGRSTSTAKMIEPLKLERSHTHTPASSPPAQSSLPRTGETDAMAAYRR